MYITSPMADRVKEHSKRVNALGKELAEWTLRLARLMFNFPDIGVRYLPVIAVGLFHSQ